MKIFESSFSSLKLIKNFIGNNKKVLLVNTTNRENYLKCSHSLYLKNNDNMWNVDFKDNKYLSWLTKYLQEENFDYIFFKTDDKQENIEKYKKFEEKHNTKCIVTINMQKNKDEELAQEEKQQIINLLDEPKVSKIILYKVSKFTEEYYREYIDSNKDLSYNMIRKILSRNVFLSKEVLPNKNNKKLYLYKDLEILVNKDKIIWLKKRDKIKNNIDNNKIQKLNQILKIKSGEVDYG